MRTTPTRRGRPATRPTRSRAATRPRATVSALKPTAANLPTGLDQRLVSCAYWLSSLRSEPSPAEADHHDPARLDPDHRAVAELRVADLLAQPVLGHVRIGPSRPARPTRIVSLMASTSVAGPLTGHDVSRSRKPPMPPRPLLLAIGQLCRDLRQEAAGDRVAVRAEHRPLPRAGHVEVPLRRA